MLTLILLGVGCALLICSHHMWLERDADDPHRVRIGNGEPFRESQPVSSDAAFALRRVVLADSSIDVATPTSLLGDYRSWSVAEHPHAVAVLCCTTPKLITMSSDMFAAYLREEGLPSELQANGSQVTEEYRKCAKLMLAVAGDAMHQPHAPAGYAELLPLGGFQFRFVLDGRPVAGVQLRLATDGGVQGASADADGEARFEPVAGRWCVSGVTMRIVASGAIERQSFWASVAGPALV